MHSPNRDVLRFLWFADDDSCNNSNSNWTFIALNLPKQEDSTKQKSRHQNLFIQCHSRGQATIQLCTDYQHIYLVVFGPPAVQILHRENVQLIKFTISMKKP